MDLRIITNKQKKQYNKLVSHIIQSWEWGEFRQGLVAPLLRYGLYQNNKLNRAFQLTLHKIPFINSFVGYLPKGPYPDQDLAKALVKIGQENHCAFIKIEPNIEISKIDSEFKISPKPLFTKYNFILDLTKSEEQLLRDMHPKFRYNIKVAQKHGVAVEQRSDDAAFEDYLKLYFETTKRQSYHGHNPDYHRKVWQTLKAADMTRLLIAYYSPSEASTQESQRVPLAAWMLVNFKDTLYYPYGGSSDQYKNVMASNLVAWEAIKLGKRLGFKKFDLWGALGPDADSNDPWQGFHRFKSQMGGELVEYIGTFDLVFNRPVYHLFTLIDRLMWLKVLLLKVF